MKRSLRESFLNASDEIFCMQSGSVLEILLLWAGLGNSPYIDKSHSFQGYSGNVVEGRRFLVKEAIFGRT